MSLDSEERLRYARHLSLDEIGEAGQARLKNARVLIVGVGGLGCPAALYLAGAGIGTLGLVDSDRVDVTNLQRQILYRTSDAGMRKVERAQAQLQTFNSHIEVHSYPFALDATNALELISRYDFVLDATDNFPTRYLVNDACFFLKKTNIFASVTRFEGRLAVFSSGGPCYRCLFPAPPEEIVFNCASQGIVGAVAGVLGTLQALETLKCILQLGSTLQGSLVLFDLLTLELRKISIAPNPECPLCGPKAKIKKLEILRPQCPLAPEISALALAELLAQQEGISLIDVRETIEYQSGTISGARSIPLESLLEARVSVSKAIPVILFCKSGQRSQRAAQHLLREGFTAVSSLAGGFTSWNNFQDNLTQAETRDGFE